MRAKRFLIAIAIALLAAACSGSGTDTTSTTGPLSPPTSETTIPPTTAPVDQTDATTPPRTTPSTTTTTAPAIATTRSAARSTTTTSAGTAPATTANEPPSRPPAVAIAAPGSLERFEATYDSSTGDFGATVQLSAQVSDPDGDSVTIKWFSDLHGFLGTGVSLARRLKVFGDASQPVITAVATDSTGASASASRQIIVWILSDT